MIHYFCLSESYNEEHIGTVVASSTKELIEKIIEALEAHFDCEVETIGDIDLENVVPSYGVPYNFNVYLKDDNIPLEASIIKSYVY